jgi:chemotaxis protein methyltransferase CheR
LRRNNTNQMVNLNTRMNMGEPQSGVSPLTMAQFAVFKQMAMRHAGIMLPDYKRNMVYRRLGKRLAALGLSDFDDYVPVLTGPDNGSEIQNFINALTTNKTEFFRESHHFEHLRAVGLQDWRMRSSVTGNPRLRLWSAGCSSGQEPYSIAMTLLDILPDAPRRDIRILATDIDTEMTERGRAAVYPMDEIELLSAAHRQKYVEYPAQDRDVARFSKDVRSLINFNALNLHDVWPMKGHFDIIFCRNVIIYFDKPTQARLFDRFASQMVDGGYLYIGHSETLYKVCDRFEPVGQSIYRKIS